MEWYHVWWPWLTSKRAARFVSDSWVSCPSTLWQDVADSQSRLSAVALLLIHFAHNVMGSSVAQWPHRPKIWGQSLKPFSPNLVNRAWGTYNTYDYKFEPYSILDSTQCRVESNKCRNAFSSMTLTGVWRAFLSCDWLTRKCRYERRQCAC